MADTEKIFSRLQNGNDIRGAAIAANGEERTLTPDLAQFAAAALASGQRSLFAAGRRRP